MRRLLLLLAVLLMAAPAMAQDPARPPAPSVVSVPVTATVTPGIPSAVRSVEIEGPETVIPGQPVQFSVTGLPDDSLAEIDVTYFPRLGVVCVPARTWKGDDIIWFVAGVEKEYIVSIHAPGGLRAEIVVTTEGAPVPPPDPTPGPTPQPSPGKRTVMVVHESGALTSNLSQQLEELRAYVRENEEKIPRLRFMDPDLKDPEGETPEWFKGYLKVIEAKGFDLPVLMVGVLSDKEDRPLVQLYVEPLPDTSEEIIAAVKKYGG